jgi:hypothetical protein
MLFTLISLVLTTLISVPVVRKVWLDLKNDDVNESSLEFSDNLNNTKDLISPILTQSNDLLTLEQESNSNTDLKSQDIIKQSSTINQRRSLVHIDWSQAEHLTKKDDSKTHGNSSIIDLKEKNKQDEIKANKDSKSSETHIPWHEPWQAAPQIGDQNKKKDSQTTPHTSAPIESNHTKRHTPTADELFKTLEDSTQSSTQSAPRNSQTQEDQSFKSKNDHSKNSNQRKNQTQTSKETSSSKSQPVVQKDSKREQHLLHSRKQRLSKVQVTAKREPRRKSPIKMIITEAPAALPQTGHFEVIKPQGINKKEQWRTQGQPEQWARGEQSWMSMQPAYIDFSSFFSLDALRSIEDVNPYDMRNLMLKSSSQSKYLEELELEEESNFETSNIPEWQFLLGQVNGFLFNMKLKQQRLPHIYLTDQNLEESLSFNIMGKVQNQTTSINASSQKKNHKSANEATSKLRKQLKHKSELNISIKDEIDEIDAVDHHMNHKIKYNSAFDTNNRDTQFDHSNASINSWGAYSSNTHKAKTSSQKNNQTFNVTEANVGITQKESSNTRGTF